MIQTLAKLFIIDCHTKAKDEKLYRKDLNIIIIIAKVICLINNYITILPIVRQYYHNTDVQITIVQ